MERKSLIVIVHICNIAGMILEIIYELNKELTDEVHATCVTNQAISIPSDC